MKSPDQRRTRAVAPCTFKGGDLATDKRINPITAVNQEGQSTITRYERMLRLFEKRMPHSICLCSPIQFVVPLLLLLFTQAEIVTEHGLERFSFAILKITDVWRADCPEDCSNSFHVRTLSPDGKRKALNDHF